MERNNKLSFIAGRYTLITPSNIDVIYTMKLNRYLFRKSSEKLIKGDEEYLIPKYDAEGNFTNAEFNSKTQNGFPLTVKDFINYEFDFLDNKFDWEVMDLGMRKTLQAWKQLLNEKMKFIPVHDYNFWNEDAYAMFKYLHENYYNNAANQRLSDIWHYLKELSRNNKKYRFTATKENYQNFISKEYDIDLTNMDKRENYDKEKIKMDDYRKDFESLLNWNTQ